MLANYAPSKIVKNNEYALEFLVDRDGGLSFPCDKDGNVFEMAEAANRNYENALKHPEKYPYRYNKVTKRTHTYKEPAQGDCVCGEHIYLFNQYLGACECPNCGRWYNLFGQELTNPSTWFVE